jgi:hypothetical protein
VTYDQWINGGYCPDVIATYYQVAGTSEMCEGAGTCCSSPTACAGDDSAWHFWNSAMNAMMYVGPPLNMPSNTDCTFWNGQVPSRFNYQRITVCER